MAIRESVSFTTVINRQLDRIAEAASSLDFTTRMAGRRTLLNYVMRVRALYYLVRDIPIVKQHLNDWDKILDALTKITVLEKFNAKLRLPTGVVEINDPFSVVKLLEEILGDIIEALFRSRLLIQIDYLGGET